MLPLIDYEIWLAADKYDINILFCVVISTRFYLSCSLAAG